MEICGCQVNNGIGTYECTCGKKENERDPWKHRSKGMVCATCMFYVRKKNESEVEGSTEIGRCRRNAPTMKGFPAVFPTDWCGDHRIDENKL